MYLGLLAILMTFLMTSSFPSAEETMGEDPTLEEHLTLGEDLTEVPM